jgi:3-hydroxyisobutyrate dehydrogenase
MSKINTIAFIGLGNMGGPMAANLVKAGFAVTAFDLSSDALALAVKNGCTTAQSVAEAVEGKDAVITMLPAGKHVRGIYGGEAGVMAHARAGALFCDCSTIDVQSARDVAADAQSQGFIMVDSPVSGGVAAASAGTLAFMVGGSDAAFAAAKPVLEPMAKAVLHAGDSGAGQAVKICNNMLLGITMIGTAEAFVLARKLGLDTQRFFDISSAASGQNWSMTSYCPEPGPVPASPANNGYKPGFSTAMMLKDLRLAQDAAQTSGTATPLGAEAQALYAMFDSLGGGATDFSGIIQMLSGEMAK